MTKPWTDSMPDEQFALMRDILGAPSPVGLEAAMTMGVIQPYLAPLVPKDWAFDTCKGNAGLVVDSHPGRDDMFSVMVIGHADKIRLQVRSIGEDGKIWINSDSFLPMTLVGHEVVLFSQNPDSPGEYRSIRGGTVEALGAIHFADASLRTGEKGITKEMLYLELQLSGEDRKKRVEALGIKSGDTILLERKIRRGFSKDTYYGAYLDNGLGCFVSTELARLTAERGGFDNVRTLFAMATHEEIGRMGSRVLVGQYKPDVIIAVDVAHDLDAAPGVKDRRYTPNAMGKGFTLSVGSITSEYVNGLIESACRSREIPYQLIVKGRDTGTDAMAAVFAAVDSAAVSIGVPIRNMHTISETGHTGDVLTAIHGLFGTLEEIDQMKLTGEDLRERHPRLDQCEERVDD